MFSNSRTITVNGGVFYHSEGSIDINHDQPQVQAVSLLQEYIAPEAFHDSGERLDPPKCHRRTRQAILDKLMAWIEQDGSAFHERLRWMYGSAGAGKSAIMQTIVELCHARGLLLAAFFFSRTSDTRNQRTRLVPTIAYQIALCSSTMAERIGHAIVRDPSIFQRSLEAQVRSLVINPILGFDGPAKLPPFIAIDGLDECYNPDDQRLILTALTGALNEHMLPIKLIVASRPEPHIRASFDSYPLCQLSSRFSLNDASLRASNDIELFLREKFHEIKATHPLRSYIPNAWPTEKQIRQIIQKSSGNFIYASAAIRFVQDTRHRPVQRLESICSTAPYPPREKPFAELDALYTAILSSADCIEPVLQVLAMLIAPRPPVRADSIVVKLRPSFIEAFLGMSQGDLRFYLMDIGSLVDLDAGDNDALTIYHESFTDFITDESRSGKYYTDLSEIHTFLASLCLQHLASRYTFVPDASSQFEIYAYADSFLMHHCKYAVLRDTLFDILSDFDATSFLVSSKSNDPSLTPLNSWPMFFDFMHLLENKGLARAMLLCERQFQNLDRLLHAKLQTYNSDPRLVDLVTLVTWKESDLFQDGLAVSPFVQQWGKAALGLTEELVALDQQTLDLFGYVGFCTGELMADSIVYCLPDFLLDEERAGEYYITGDSFAAVAFRFAEQLSDPDDTAKTLTENALGRLVGLDLFAFFLSHACVIRDLQAYLREQGPISSWVHQSEHCLEATGRVQLVIDEYLAR